MISTIIVVACDAENTTHSLITKLNPQDYENLKQTS